jgi:hypothetical protein
MTSHTLGFCQFWIRDTIQGGKLVGLGGGGDFSKFKGFPTFKLSTYTSATNRREVMIVYERTPLIHPTWSLEIVYNPKVILYSWFDIKINLKDPKLIYLRSFEMNRQQSYRVSNFYFGWMKCMLSYDTSLSPPQVLGFTTCPSLRFFLLAMIEI